RDREPMEHAKAAAAGTFDPGLLRRMSWRVRDVLRPPPPRPEADVIAAFNFAVCELHERADLLRYLKNSHTRLNRGGIFAADLYFGPGAWRRGVEKKKVRTAHGIINYEWEQRSADPLTGRVENVIHFVLPRGKRMRNAFIYDWRLWSVAELRDAMTEAGFRSTEVHNSYGGAIDENGDPVPLAVNDGRELNDENNVVYVVARR
ncbi:MAG TPA: hypothetical protein VG797_05655, partial [Phycisphaerales bacterium]|nr:hypothetical protein [Phycisphaerales bacterium]